MLEESRKKGASIFIYLIFCLLIAIFVINFGPQGGGRDGGCTGSSNVVVSVDGKEATQSSYHIYYANPYNRGTGKQHIHVALESLIRRELLAQAAEARGLRATTSLVEDGIKKGHFYLAGQRAQIPGILSEDGLWNLNVFRNWVSQLNVSKNSYLAEQERGLLAYMMAQILLDSVGVSRDEALQHFLFENNTVQYDAVAFRPEPYRAAMKLTDADVERFLAGHATEVDSRYKADERTYKAVKPQLYLRQIFIAKLEEEKPPSPAPVAPAQGSAAGSAAGSGAGAGAGSAVATSPQTQTPSAKVGEAKLEPPKKKAGMKIDEAKAKLEAARTAIAANKQKFVDAAKQLSTDEAAKANGGELGWRTADNAMLGDKAVTDAVKVLKAGEMTPVITTDRGAYLLIAEQKREGDLTFEQVKYEIAKELARDVWGKEAAERAALTALDNARKGLGMNLDQMYEKEKTPEGPGIDIQQILNDPNLSPEEKQRLLQMFMSQQQKSGSIVIEGKDQPASWRAQADGTSGSAAPPAAGSAASKAAPSPAPNAAGSAAPKAAGSAAPKAADSPTAGSAAPKAAGSAGAAAPTDSGSLSAGTAVAPAATAPTEAATVASTDVLPQFGEIPKPTVARFGPAPRSSTMSGVGSSKEAAAALFDELTPGMLAKKVFEGDGAFVIVQLVSRSQPKVEDFDKDADRLIEEIRKQRAEAFLEEWLKDRCEKLAKDNRILPNPGLIREHDDNGKPLPISYRPCMSFLH